MSEWSAVFVDTNIFIKAKYNFDGGNLERLKSFRYRPECLVVDDIVFGEVVSNFSSSLVDHSKKLKKSAKEAFSGKLISFEEKESITSLLVDDEGAKERAEELFEDYLEQCDAIHISTHEYCNVREVVSNFFSSFPPFEEKESKKHEFPDALCLSAINSWAIENDKKVVVVTDDRGWSGFSEFCDGRIRVVGHISEALDLFQDFDVKSFYLELVYGNWDDVRSAIEEVVQQEFYSGVVEGFTEVVATSYLPYDAEIDDLSVDKVEFIKEGGEVQVSLMGVPEEGFEGEFYISVSAEVSYSVNASFSFSVMDSVDKDMVFLGAVGSVSNNVDEIEVTVCLFYEDGVVRFCSADISGIPSYIVFGDVEPDFS